MNKEMLENLINENLTQQQIAEKLNTSRRNIRNFLIKFNLKTKNTQLEKHLKRCPKCKEIKDRDLFYKNKKGSLNAVTSYCINCVKETNAIRKREVKKLAINYLGGKCKVCGYNKCDAALEFHHLNPNEKDPDYNNLRSAFTDKLKIELDKCILVCANCHREIHNGLNIDTV